MALGMQSKFSWGSVAMGALGSGVMAGVGGAFNGASFLSGNQALSESIKAGIANGTYAGANAMQMAVRATVSSTVTQGIAMATGLQSSSAGPMWRLPAWAREWAREWAGSWEASCSPRGMSSRRT